MKKTHYWTPPNGDVGGHLTHHLYFNEEFVTVLTTPMNFAPREEHELVMDSKIAAFTNAHLRHYMTEL